MKNDSTSFAWDITVVMAVVLGLLVAVVVILQIILTGPSTTTLETTLFSILQFLLSLGFAWVLSRLSFRREFEDSQKRFAVAAFRRICEIDMAASRLISAIRSGISQSRPDSQSELKILHAISVGIRQTAKSSIADWGDIIGEEIATMEKIEDLKIEQETLSENSRVGSIEGESVPEVRKLEESLKALENQLDQLSQALPAPLKILARSSIRHDDNGISRAHDYFAQQLHQSGTLSLKGFWEPNCGFSESVDHLEVGQMLTASIGDSKDRVASLLIRDKNNDVVGVVTNSAMASDYPEFVAGIVRAIGSSQFPIKLSSIDRRKLGRRIQFHLLYERNVEPDPVPAV